MSDRNEHNPQEAMVYGLATLYRYAQEDKANRADDPEFTIKDLAKIAKVSCQYMRKLVRDSGLGRERKLSRRGRPEMVVKLSEIARLRQELQEHEDLFGE